MNTGYDSQYYGGSGYDEMYEEKKKPPAPPPSRSRPPTYSQSIYEDDDDYQGGGSQTGGKGYTNTANRNEDFGEGPPEKKRSNRFQIMIIVIVLIVLIILIAIAIPLAITLGGEEEEDTTKPTTQKPEITPEVGRNVGNEQVGKEYDWGQWQSWGKCLDQGGGVCERLRERNCGTDAAPQFGKCGHGTSYENEQCSDCPTTPPGTWQPWREWGDCLDDGFNGCKQYRSRSCSQHGQCTGKDSGDRTCTGCRLNQPPTNPGGTPEDCYGVYTANQFSGTRFATIAPYAGDQRTLGVLCAANTMETPNDPGYIVIAQMAKTINNFFDKTYRQYEDGFGYKENSFEESFYLGNRIIHDITRSRTWKLKLEIEDEFGQVKKALYHDFELDGPGSNYKLRLKSVVQEETDSDSDLLMCTYRIPASPAAVNSFDVTGQLSKLIPEQFTHGNYQFLDLVFPFGVQDKEFSAKDYGSDKTCADEFGNGWWFNRQPKARVDLHMDKLFALIPGGTVGDVARAALEFWLRFGGNDHIQKLLDVMRFTFPRTVCSNIHFGKGYLGYTPCSTADIFDLIVKPVRKSANKIRLMIKREN